MRVLEVLRGVETSIRKCICTCIESDLYACTYIFWIGTSLGKKKAIISMRVIVHVAVKDSREI
jgi:hypothetical protein